jgi:hypothetical protein
MDKPIVLDRNELLAAWHRLVPTAEGVMRDRYELNAFGEVVVNGCPSGTRQLAFTGAKEVIVVNQDGAIEFWGAEGRHQASTFAITLSVEPIQASVWVGAVDLYHRAAECTATAARDADRWVGARGMGPD